jgi:RNA polymerase primary sigma factor
MLFQRENIPYQIIRIKDQYLRSLKVLAKTINSFGPRSNRSISRYFSEIGKFSPLPPEREVELAIRIQNGDDLAMKELVESNLRFVVSVAKKYQGNGISLADLINEGNLGLIKAAKRFDHSRGFKFISYAVWWIRQSILQALAEQARLIRLPLNRVGTITKMTKTAEKLEAEIERQPKADEISHQLSMSSDQIVDAMMYSRKHSSLDTPFQDGEENSLMDVIENPHEDSPDNLLMRESLKEDVKLSLEPLADRERTVIEMYYGINGGRALTLNEIGEIFNLTRERIRQIKAKAIQRLGHKSRSNLLRQYLG